MGIVRYIVHRNLSCQQNSSLWICATLQGSSVVYQKFPGVQPFSLQYLVAGEMSVTVRKWTEVVKSAEN
jgi:hypothetical protein